MKVLLVLPPNIGRYIVATIPHAGIAYLAAFLERDGHKAEVHDMRIDADDKHLASKIESFKPELIGVSSASIGYKMAYEIINSIKRRHPDIPVAMGGSYASTVHTKVLEDTKADYTVYGEGETIIVPLARALLTGGGLAGIRNLIWRKDGGIVVNEPAPLLADLDALTAAPGFWDDQQAAQGTMKRLADLNAKIETWRGLERRGAELRGFIDLAEAEAWVRGG